ncbi:MAG: glutamine amidotransferase [Proteobacteria bacterium]|nr:glutamine amidotransferase [Pseudomonadota bacterium]
MTLLIVQTGTAIPAVRRQLGDFAQWFRRGLGLSPRQARGVRVDRGASLPAPGSVAGVIVTGSGAMVTDRLAWSEATARWLRRAIDADIPVLGVCYGHQLLAHAMGGRVGYNPRGREMGTVEIARTRAAHEDALFGSMPDAFAAQATHLQTVLEPPRDAVVLARSSLDSCQAVRFAPRAWGLQFHPEFGAREMGAYIRARDGALADEDFNVPAMLREVRATPQARSVLRRFARLALRG